MLVFLRVRQITQISKKMVYPLVPITDASGLTEKFQDSFFNSYEDNYGLPLISIWILLEFLQIN